MEQGAGIHERSSTRHRCNSVRARRPVREGDERAVIQRGRYASVASEQSSSAAAQANSPGGARAQLQRGSAVAAYERT